jgi:cell division protein ZapA
VTGPNAANAPKNAVRVTIGGEEYTVRSELPPEYTREVAAYVDASLKRVRDMLPSLETHKVAILAALAITDELFQARRGDRDIANRLNAIADDLARLLPPAKRGGRASGHAAVVGEPAPEHTS